MNKIKNAKEEIFLCNVKDNVVCYQLSQNNSESGERNIYFILKSGLASNHFL